MKTRLRMIAVAACCLLTGGLSRADDRPIPIEVPARTVPVDFESEIAPLLRASCIACHNQQNAEAGLVLESPKSILQGGDQGPAVVAGNSAESLLLKVAAHEQESFMPPADNDVGAPPLTPTQLGLIKLWIDQGATGSVSANRTIHWQPLPSGYQPIFATALTPDGQFAVCSRGNRLSVYHLPSVKLSSMLVDPSVADSAGVSQPDAAHVDIIRALAFDSSGSLLASGSFREVKLWRRPLVERLARWAHDAPLRCVAVSGDGRRAATGDETGHIRLWQLATGRPEASFAAHQTAVTGIQFAPDAATLYSSSLDQSLRAWSVADGSAIGHVETSSPIQTLATINQGDWLVTGHNDGYARVWQAAAFDGDAAAAMTPKLEIHAHDKPITALAAMASHGTEFLSGGDDGLVRRWNAETGQQVRELRGDDGRVVALAASGDGRRIASAGTNGVQLWNADDGRSIAEWNVDPRRMAEVSRIEAEIAFTKSAVSWTQRDIKAYEGPERRVMTTAENVKKAEEELAKAEKTRDEKRAAAEKAKAEDKNVEAAEKAAAEAETAVAVAGTVVERATVIAERAVKELADAQQTVADGEQLLERQEAEKESAVTAAEAARLQIRSLAFSADGNRLAIGCEDGAVHFHDSDAGTHSETRAEHTGSVLALAFASDGTLVTGSSDRHALVWNAGSQWRLERVVGQMDQAELLADRVLALDFSRDGQWLATGGGVPSRSGELKIWNVADGRLVREFPDAHSDTVFAVRFSPDGRYLATAAADRLVKIFDLDSGECARVFAGHTAHALGVSWSGDGRMLVSCGADQVLKLWDVETGVPLHTMKGTTYRIGAYKGEVTAVSFIGESEQILAASGDGTVRLHRTSSSSDIVTFAGSAGYQYSVAVTPDGQTVVAGGSDGTLRLWSGQTPQVKHSFAP